jgi:hypothetical protein
VRAVTPPPVAPLPAVERPAERPPSEDLGTNPFEMAAEVTSESPLPPGEPALPPGADPMTTETRDLPVERDAWLDAFAAGAAPQARCASARRRRRSRAARSTSSCSCTGSGRTR